MRVDIRAVAGRFKAAGGRIAGPVLAAAAIIALIDFFPIEKAGINPGSLAKGLVAVPVGIAFAFGARYLKPLAFTLLGILSALLLAFDASGYYQNDVACDIAILGLFTVGAWITIPLAIASPPRRMAASFALPSLGASPPMRVDKRHTWNRALAAAAIAVLAVLATLMEQNDAPTTWRLAAGMVDAALGSAAVYVIGNRFAGRVAGLAAAILWMFSGIRFDFFVQYATALQPTALVPVVVAATLTLRSSGKLRSVTLGLAFAAAFAAIVYNWPLLALSAGLSSVLILWSVGYRAEAAWVGVACFVSATATLAAFGGAPLQGLGLQTMIADPVQAAAACASGCDGALPWEFFYPSAYGGAYAGVLAQFLTTSLHWGNYQYFSISPGWSQICLALVGAGSMLRSNVALIRAACVAVACSMLLALPSHYLGFGLPSLVHVLTVVAPGFQFGSQCALTAGLFVALLGGIGISRLCAGSSRRTAINLCAAAAAIALDSTFLPPAHGASETFARATRNLPPSAGPIAFYPFLTASYGSQFYALARIAERRGFELVNARSGLPPEVPDLSAPQTLQTLRIGGVRLVIVSLDDYARRREFLRDAHILLPADQRAATDTWRAPDAVELAAARVLRTDVDGVLVLSLDDIGTGH